MSSIKRSERPKSKTNCVRKFCGNGAPAAALRRICWNARWPERGFRPSIARLCQELVYGVVRWQATLDWLIARKTDGREQKPGLQNLLRLGLYQIFWLDRIPDHAAVHETVELAKQQRLRFTSRFCERRFARLFARSRTQAKKLLADLKISQPALGWSHPEWLVARWQKRLGRGKDGATFGVEQHAAENLCAGEHAEISEGGVIRRPAMSRLVRNAARRRERHSRKCRRFARALARGKCGIRFRPARLAGGKSGL